MKKIPLTQGLFALVDDEDYEIVNQYKWCATWNEASKTFYAVRKCPKNENNKHYPIIMHRFILGLGKGDKRQGHHKDFNGLNNTRQNIEIVSNRENHEKLKHNSKYGVGISIDKREKAGGLLYKVCCYKNGKQKHIGMYATTEEAQSAREKYKKDNNL